MKQKIIAIVGPTASGKTALSIALAKALKGEVISADSRQVYRGLNLGTGKVTKCEMAGVPHHLIDVASPKRQFSVDTFVRQATRAVATIHKRNHVPLVVGGTGLYIDTLLGRMGYAPVPPNPALRKRLAAKSAAQLVAHLKRLDPVSALRVDPHNKVRLIRAIEVAAALGAVPAPTAVPRYDVLWLGLNPAQLDARIGARLSARLKQGMLAEAKRLHKQGLSYKRMEELGLEYRYLARLLKKDMGKKEFEAELLRAIRHYAKRQMRWFKRNTDIHWVATPSEALRLANKFLSGR